MIFNVNGNVCSVYIPANEVSEGRVNIDLPDGYSYKTILIIYSKNVIEINNAVTVVVGSDGKEYNVIPSDQFK